MLFLIWPIVLFLVWSIILFLVPLSLSAMFVV